MDEQTTKSLGRQFLDDIFTPDRLKIIEQACTGNRFVSAEKIQATIAEAFMREPRLYKCTPISVFRSCMLASRLDLDASGHHNGASFVPRKNNYEDCTECHIQLGYGAKVDLATRDGRIQSFTTCAVYPSDKFNFKLGTERFIEHEPNPNRPIDEKPIWFYAIAWFPNGGYEFDLMTIQEVEAVRDQYATDRYGNVSKAWKTSLPEQGRKTVLHRLLKRLPMNPVLSEAFASSDIADGYDFRSRVRNTAESVGVGVESLRKRIANINGTPPTEPDEPAPEHHEPTNPKADDDFATDIAERMDAEANK